MCTTRLKSERMGTATRYELCERQSGGRPTVLLLELHLKVSGGEKQVTYPGRNDAVLAFVYDCTI